MDFPYTCFQSRGGLVSRTNRVLLLLLLTLLITSVILYAVCHVHHPQKLFLTFGLLIIFETNNAPHGVSTYCVYWLYNKYHGGGDIEMNNNIFKHTLLIVLQQIGIAFRFFNESVVIRF